MRAVATIILACALLAGCNITGSARWFQQSLPRSY